MSSIVNPLSNPPLLIEQMFPSELIDTVNFDDIQTINS
jgi:hypothetical protein